MTISSSTARRIQLGHLNPGMKAVITRVGRLSEVEEFTERLLEMGFLEGAQVEVVHQAPFGGDPIAVRVRGTLIALRRNEANAIEVLVYEN